MVKVKNIFVSYSKTKVLRILGYYLLTLESPDNEAKLIIGKQKLMPRYRI